VFTNLLPRNGLHNTVSLFACCIAMSVIGLPFLLVPQFAQCLLSNCSCSSLLEAAHPWQFPHRVPVGPGVSQSSCFSDQWDLSSKNGQCSYISYSLAVSSVFFRFGGSWPFHAVLSLTFWSLTEIQTACFTTSNSRVCLRALCNVFTLPRHSCRLAPWFLMPLMPSGFARCLFLNVCPLGAPVETLS
jgi:hypothetical protein